MTNKISEDNSSSCAFTYSDGRHCRMSRSFRSSKYCLHHERKMRGLREADATAAYIAEPIANVFMSSTSLNAAVARLFGAIADGRVPLKTAAQLIAVSKILLKTVPNANREFLMSFGSSKTWDRLVRQMYICEEPAPSPAESAAPPSTNNSNSENSDLPKTPAEFLKAVAAVL